MRSMSLTALLAAAVALPVIMAGSASAHDRDGNRYGAYRKYDRKHVVDRRQSRDDSYAARANNLDPAGDYKAYPDWARVALSPKFDRGFR